MGQELIFWEVRGRYAVGDAVLTSPQKTNAESSIHEGELSRYFKGVAVIDVLLTFRMSGSLFYV